MFSIWTLVSLGVMVASCLNVLLLSRSTTISGDTKRNYSWIGHDYPENLDLELPYVLLTEEESVHFTIGPDKDDVWHSPTPTRGIGYLHLGPDNRLFALSMIHEVHCLWILHRALSHSTPERLVHAQHCIGYLRHAALCDADLTLERGDFVARDFRQSPTGATHVCRDWSIVYNVLEDMWQKWDETGTSDTV